MSSKSPKNPQNKNRSEDLFESMMADYKINPLDPDESKSISPKNMELSIEIGDTIIKPPPPQNRSKKYAGFDHTQSKPKHAKRIKVNKHFQADFVLDLHGETRDSALQKVNYAFKIAERKNYQSLLVITGKGINSENAKGVLRSFIWEQLSYRKREGEIADFKNAPNFLGGNGAILVFFYQ